MYAVKVEGARELVMVCQVLLALLHGAELAGAALHQAQVDLRGREGWWVGRQAGWWVGGVGDGSAWGAKVAGEGRPAREGSRLGLQCWEAVQ